MYSVRVTSAVVVATVCMVVSTPVLADQHGSTGAQCAGRGPQSESLDPKHDKDHDQDRESSGPAVGRSRAV